MQSNLTAVETKQAPTKSKKAVTKAVSTKRAQVSKMPRTLSLAKSEEDPHSVYMMEPADRIKLIKRGVHADAVSALAKRMAWTKERFIHSLGLSVTTIDRRVRQQEKLTTHESERYVGVIKLIGQVQAIVEQSGDPTHFDAAQWFALWLDKPLPALGGDKPVEYIDTSEGRELLSRLIAMAQSGAYA
ncbi:MbcA/ParS/Xre antitoxin family protein [Paralcaligenes sp. KSB-10]|uniref:antitoxin Xre/MbcA/ParS toxin-binding domain-containing protein n=1 Tax=Paralcaligenes sp. KSB-10 TaxID=2901142 RepID=UPI001E33846F|nr:antitoxin Xre/MbcA/ParS toxin-binding domain-containing protein [Paralcaligenes sp. KSB-10]UHL63260.1 MbcA/ParS/Xre antitoxin family protein [Paralcaligenes sp. KSB-10]